MTDLTIIVSSCDRFEACWVPFAHGFNKYWPDHNGPVLLITNEKQFAQGQVRSVGVGPDRGWSDNLLSVLERVNTRYVLYLQEDYWFSEPVDRARLQEYLELMDREPIDYLRLIAVPEPDQTFTGDARLGKLAREASYRTSLQAAIWRTDTLRQLIQPGESPWEFEVLGTERSRDLPGLFLSVWAVDDDYYELGLRYLCSAINRGRWSRYAKKYAEREGIRVNFEDFPSETWWHDWLRDTSGGQAVDRWRLRIRSGLIDPAEVLRRLQGRLTRQTVNRS